MTTDDIQAKIFEIAYLRTKLKKDIHQKRNELLQFASQFDSYQDLYTYTRKTSENLEDFNNMMAAARDIFLDNH